MNLKEYLKETIEKVDNKEDEGGMLGIYLTEELKFMYHDECFADWHEDFVLVYDKVTETQMVVPFDKITTLQYMCDKVMEKQLEKQMEKVSFKDFLKMLDD